MKKIICIGECVLDIVFKDRVPVGSMAGGRIVNAAALLASEGLPVKMIGEASADGVGDIVVNFLESAKADTSSVDRFTEGVTPTLLYIPDDGRRMTVTRYESYPDDCFDVVWPRIDAGDILVFGGFYALDPRMRARLVQLLSYARERSTVIIYLPGFLPSQAPRITRVMPAILENLEAADLVITRDQDISTVFGTSDAAGCYADHINFYCNSLINISPTGKQACFYCGNETSVSEIMSDGCLSLIWNSGIVAGAAKAIYENGMEAADLASPDNAVRGKILAEALDCADRAFHSLKEEWQKHH